MNKKGFLALTVLLVLAALLLLGLPFTTERIIESRMTETVTETVIHQSDGDDLQFEYNSLTN